LLGVSAALGGRGRDGESNPESDDEIVAGQAEGVTAAEASRRTLVAATVSPRDGGPRGDGNAAAGGGFDDARLAGDRRDADERVLEQDEVVDSVSPSAGGMAVEVVFGDAASL